VENDCRGRHTYYPVLSLLHFVNVELFRADTLLDLILSTITTERGLGEGGCGGERLLGHTYPVLSLLHFVNVELFGADTLLNLILHLILDLLSKLYDIKLTLLLL